MSLCVYVYMCMCVCVLIKVVILPIQEAFYDADDTFQGVIDIVSRQPSLTRFERGEPVTETLSEEKIFQQV